MDEEGYLCLPGFGRVLNPNGDEIYLATDKLYGDAQGILYYEQGGVLGQLGVYTFEDLAALERNPQGLFVGEGAQQAQGYELVNGYVERSNTDVVKQMTDMIAYQRSLQSATQVMKMYDSLMNQATTEIGRM